MGQRTGHGERLKFKLIHKGVEFSAFLGGERAIIALGEQVRHPFAPAGRHAERAAHAPCCLTGLSGRRKAFEFFQQLPTLRLWQLDDGIAKLFER